MKYKDLNFQFKHVGVNSKDEKSAILFADFFTNYFNMPESIGKDSIFIESKIEIMKGPGFGEHGHIAIGTDNIHKAKELLESLGLEFLQDSKKYDENGEMILIYIKQEINGFAIHLLQN